MNKLKKRLIISGIIGLIIGIIFSIMLIFGIKLNLPVWMGVPLLWIIGLPFLMTMGIFTLFGYNEFGYILLGVVSSLILYFLWGVLIYYIYYRIKVYTKKILNINKAKNENMSSK